MRMVGNSNYNCIDVFPRKQILVLLISVYLELLTGIGVEIGNTFLKTLALDAINIASGNNFHSRYL